MGRMGRMKALHPCLSMIFSKWFLVVPSMLLVSLFCLWTLFSLLAFTLFSHSRECSGQECRPTFASHSHSRLKESSRLLFKAGLSALNEQQENLSLVQPGTERRLQEGIDNNNSNNTEAEEERYTFSSVNVTGGLLEVEDRRSSHEDYSEAELAGEQERVQRNIVSGEEDAEMPNGVSALQQQQKISLSEKQVLLEDVEQEQEQHENASTNRTATETEPEETGDADDLTAAQEEEESAIIGGGLQAIMSNLRPYSSNVTRWMSSDSEGCAGRWIYSYKLPPRFNTELLQLCDSILPWYSLCQYFENSGMGRVVTGAQAEGVLTPRGRWHRTNQYMLDVLFHARLNEYPCLTDDPHAASLFHIPYYGGLDVFRYHYANVTFEKKDELGRELVRILQESPAWKRNGGADHFLVLGKITWDFRRTTTDWGNTLLLFPELQKVTKLLIERDPWQENEIGVPHPTFFHPASDEDMDAWIAHIASFQRDKLLSFAGMPRTTDNIRSILIQMCRARPALCRFLECSGTICFRPDATMHLFLRSHFCLQPVGDSATRRSVFDSLVAGCIPVFFSRDTAYVQYPWHLPAQISSYSVYISSDDVKAGRVDVVKLLAGISKAKRQQMKQRIIDIVPKLVYFAPNSTKRKYVDAFDVSIQSLLSKSARLRAEE